MSMDAGLQVPLIPFAEINGSAGIVAPLQADKDTPKSNDGVIFGLTVMVNEVVVAHKPEAGVNV